MNNQKRDKIPSSTLIDNRRDLITHYWDLIQQHKQQRFQKELQLALLGYENSNDWHEPAIEQLKKSCDYLISTRGFEEWNGQNNI